MFSVKQILSLVPFSHLNNYEDKYVQKYVLTVQICMSKNKYVLHVVLLQVLKKDFAHGLSCVIKSCFSADLGITVGVAYSLGACSTILFPSIHPSIF